MLGQQQPSLRHPASLLSRHLPSEFIQAAMQLILPRGSELILSLELPQPALRSESKCLSRPSHTQLPVLG